MADESTTTHATLTFPFQASLDGSALVETDGTLFYGLDTFPDIVELPAQSYREPPSRSMSDSTQTGLGLALDIDGTWTKSSLSQQHSNDEADRSLREIPVTGLSQSAGAPDIAAGANGDSHSAVTHSTSIDPSKEQRSSTGHDSAEETVSAKSRGWDSRSSTTSRVETEIAKKKTARMTVSSAPRDHFQPPRYYSTPLVKDDPSSTPVAIYGIENAPDQKPRKRPTVLKYKGKAATAPVSVRPPSKQFRRQISPLALADAATANRGKVEKSPSASLSSWSSTSSTSTTKRPSSSGSNTVPSTSSRVVSRPSMGSTSSRESAATVSTMGSVATKSSMASSVSADVESKPLPRPLRRMTAPIPGPMDDTLPARSDGTTMSISLATCAPSANMDVRNGENQSAIRAVAASQVDIGHAIADGHATASFSSKAVNSMPYSPDSFGLPRSQSQFPECHASDSTSTDGAIPNKNSQLRNPAFDINKKNPRVSNNYYHAYRTQGQSPQPVALPTRPQKSSDFHQRATKLFTRIRSMN